MNFPTKFATRQNCKKIVLCKFKIVKYFVSKFATGKKCEKIVKFATRQNCEKFCFAIIILNIFCVDMFTSSAVAATFTPSSCVLPVQTPTPCVCPSGGLCKRVTTASIHVYFTNRSTSYTRVGVDSYCSALDNTGCGHSCCSSILHL